MSIANLTSAVSNGSGYNPAWLFAGGNPDSNGVNFNTQGTTVYNPNSVPFSTLDPQTLQAIQAMGWTGGNPIISQGGSGGNQDTGPTPSSNTLSPQFQQWLAQNGLT